MHYSDAQKNISHSSEVFTSSWAGEEVSKHVLSSVMIDNKSLIVHKLLHKEIPDVDMLRVGSRRSSSHMHHSNSRCVVLVQLGRSLLESYPFDHSANPDDKIQSIVDCNKLCLLSVLEVLTNFCTKDFQ